jgi:hypothetical protein
VVVGTAEEATAAAVAGLVEEDSAAAWPVAE